MLIFQLKRTKLDEKSQKYIFVRYSSNTKGYQLYNVETNKLMVRRDVIFNEKVAWDWNENKEQELPDVVFHKQQKILNLLQDSTPLQTPSNSNSSTYLSSP